MSTSFLNIKNVSKKFGQFSALDEISFSIKKNEFVCLLGPSGCGKTTLLRIIAGLEEATSGKIELDGKDITALPPSKRDFGIVFQSYALFPNLTALQNIEYGLKNRNFSKKEYKDRALEALELVDLVHVKDKYPAHLSGGQQQRVALARAIAFSPKFLLLDEPLSALDAKVREKLRREIRSIQERIGITTIMVTHDQEEALTMADKIVVMNNAEIMQVGSPQTIYYQPSNPFVADFIGSINLWKEQNHCTRTMAIRPEHVQINAKGGVEGFVEHVEFRGPLYRLQVRVNEQTSFLFNRVMKVDMTSQAIQQFNIRKGSKISISLPHEQLLAYEEQVVV
ncbi:putative 2-aminoethylphosphonate ABC transporter ATP-binding protein [Neobacillus mesonae]|uniref:Carnitine transport ATP-binding protein OpuCA n=1 Tax=Neobacillus mesonae TaxID=1193713 RepID=A0A3Q9QS84_9BACI|nr:putative 2-aminoethylphosphonate ABC transporter ATP-binding protein [Neobacillus mesonae]AZU60175.1 phosphonate ABC transporter ATP-binding protein [Neobacillus mesonae]